MVATEFDVSGPVHRFLIRPNCSMTWRDAVHFYLGMVTVSFGIAILFAANGAWPVLPFAGLEMLVLGIALYITARRCARWEMISIDADSIHIRRSPSNQLPPVSFRRAWATIELQPGSKSWYLPRLVIRSHGQTVEVGHCLNEAERKQLARELSRALAEIV